jgi:hypothetical protein
MEQQRLAPRKTLFAACLVVSVLCLASGYASTGQWIGALIAMITGPAWLLARKYPASWLPLVCLLGSVCLAGAGMLSGSPPLLMICGSVAVLAAWDLLFLDDALGICSFGEQTRQYESQHLQALALALGCGLFLASLGGLYYLKVPFVVLILLVALAVFGLERVWVMLKKGREGR